MKLTKKLLASRVNLVRPYKSRSKRPCDFCRRRKTCCIIEKTIPCMACVQFNKGQCTFISGPLKRGNRRASEKMRQRGSSFSSESPESTGSLETPLMGYLGQVSTDYEFRATTKASTPITSQGPESTYYKHEESPLTRSLAPESNQAGSVWVPYEDRPDYVRNEPIEYFQSPEMYSRQLTLSTMSTLSTATFWEPSNYHNIQFNELVPEFAEYGAERGPDKFAYFEKMPEPYVSMDKMNMPDTYLNLPDKLGYPDYKDKLETPVLWGQPNGHPQQQRFAQMGGYDNWEQPYNAKMGRFPTVGSLGNSSDPTGAPMS